MNYYYLKNNQPVGPLNEEQLKSTIISEGLLPDTLVATEGAQQWVPLQTIPGMEETLSTLAASGIGSCPNCHAEITGYTMPAVCPHCGYEMALPPEHRESLWKHFCFAMKKSFTLRGRATRMEYWSFQLFFSIIFMGYSTICSIFCPLFLNGEELKETNTPWESPSFYAIVILVLLLMYLPFLAMLPAFISVSVRRLHDIGAGGWWIPAAILSLFAPTVVAMIPVVCGANELVFFSSYILGSALTIILCIRVIVSHFQDTQRGANKHGPSSKYPR